MNFVHAILILAGSAMVHAAAGQIPQPPGGPPAAPQAGSPPEMDLEQAMSTGPKGTLAVHAVQGTKGGPDVGSDEVEVVLVHRNQPFKQIKARLDDHGVAIFDDLPIALGIAPVVRVKHAGVLYQEVGDDLTATNTRGSVNVTVYEVTDEAPQWRITSRHLMAAHTGEDLDVVEMVIVDNPTDRTWLGAPADASGRRATVVLSLPSGASEITLESGFHGWCCTAFADTNLRIQMPLMPGRFTYRFSYHVPFSQSGADLLIKAPTQTDQVAFFVPDDGSKADLTQVQFAANDTVEGTKIRLFRGVNIAPGQAAGLVLASLPAPAAPAASAPAAPAEPPARPSSPNTVIAVIAGAAAAAGILGVLYRWKTKQRPHVSRA